MTRSLILPLAFVALPAVAAAEVPRVVTDILPVHSLVAQVMDGVGGVDLILPPNASPHSYSMRPSEAAALQSADVVFWIGAELTPWLSSSVATLAPNATSVELLEMEGTTLHLFADEGGHDDHDDHSGHADHDDHDDHADHDGHDDHDAAEGDAGHFEGDGHDHEGVDPHAWLDPMNAILWLNGIAEVLSAQDPANADTYARNAQAGADAVRAAHAQAQNVLDPVRDRPFLTAHDAYGYFETRYGLLSSGALRLGDAAPAGAGRTAGLRDAVRAEDIRCVFTEPQFSAGTATSVAEGSDARIVGIDPLGTLQSPGPQLYPALITLLAADIAGCLSQ